MNDLERLQKKLIKRNELPTKKKLSAIDKYKAEEVEDVIDAIGTYVQYPTSEQKIQDAREAYDGLNETQKALVENYDALTQAEDRFEAQKVTAKINALGQVAYPTSGEALQEARTAYNALTASQKELMSSYVVGQLESKENEYAAKGVVAKIDAIGEVANPASNAAIQEARTAYNALTDAQKEFVQQADLQKLVDAENKYPALGVIALIDAIGTVTYPTSGEAIDEANLTLYS